MESTLIRFRNRDIKHNLKQNSKLLYLVSSRHFHYSREMTRMIITHLSDLQTSTRNDISVINLVAYLTRQGSCTPPLSNHLRLCSNFVSAGHAGLSLYPRGLKFSFLVNSPPIRVNFAWRFLYHQKKLNLVFLTTPLF